MSCAASAFPSWNGRATGLARCAVVVVALLAALALTPQAWAQAADDPKPGRPYEVAYDAPLDATSRLVAEEKDHAQHRVEFNGIARDRVPAFVYVPKAPPAAKHPAVLLQYGSGGNKSTNYITALGKAFAARGFLVLTIDVPDRGERRNRETPRGWAALFRPGTILQTLGDYSRAVDYLVSRPDVDAEHIGYAGISLGAITGITFVAHEPRVRAMASIVGGANLLGAKVAWSPDIRKMAERVDPFFHVGGIAPRPLLLLNATRDQLVPRFFAEELHKAAVGGHVTKRWMETDHFFRGVDRYAVMDTVIEFMERGLGVARPGKAPAAGQ